MPLKVHVDGELLMVLMDNPPVNCLSLRLRRELFDVFTVRANSPHIAAVILLGNGKHFSAGGDLRELGTPAADAAPRISADLLPAIERCPKPVIAALHGAAIGGGFELALTCHYRIAAADTRFALPELKYGIIPLSGSQRLPRLWGVRPALQMMLDSTVVTAEEFAASGVLDRVVEPRDLLSVAQAFARQLEHSTDVGALLVRNRAWRDAQPAEALHAAIESYGAHRLTPVQQALIAAVRAGIDTADFDTAMRTSQRIYDELARHRAQTQTATV
jgi:enoyl-CoA hydratase